MANSYAITEGSGKTIGTNTTSSTEYQKIQLGNGADGSYVVIGDTNPLQVGGSAAACVGKAEDAAHTTGDVGVMALGVITTSRTPTTVTNGDYVALSLDAAGRIRTVADYAVGDGPSKFYVSTGTTTGTTTLTAAASLRTLTLSSGEATAMAYVKIYDKATAAVGGDTPVIVVALGPGQSQHLTWPNGFALANGLSMRSTSDAADSGTNSNTASTIKMFGTYI